MFKYFDLVPPKLIKSYYLMIFYFLIVSMLEILAISLLIPLLVILTGSNNLYSKYFQILNDFLSKFYFENYQATFVIVIIVTTYLSKNILLFFIIKKQNQFVQLNMVELSKKLLSNYLNQDISFHKNNNSSSLIKKISTDVQFLTGLLISSLKFYSDLIILIAILFIMLSVNFLSTILLILLLYIFFYFYFFYLRKKLNNWGSKRHQLGTLSLKSLMEAINSYKEIIIYNVKNFFIKKYYDDLYKSYDTQKKFDTFQQYPRLVLEIFILIAIFTFYKILHISGKNNSEILVILSFYIFSFIRIGPLAINIFKYLQLHQFSRATYLEIKKDLNLIIKEENTEKNIHNYKFNKQIVFSKINFSYKKKKILNSISFKIIKNEFIGIMGESGAGKTTLIEIILGLLKPDSGKILIDNKNSNEFPEIFRQIFSYVPQNSLIIGKTILDNVAFGIPQKFIDQKNVISSLNKVNFYSAKDDFLRMVVGERGNKLSEGQKQRLIIARALYKNPEILILDEITSSLDGRNERFIIKEISKLKKNKTIILISHKKSSLLYCDKVLELKNGKVTRVKFK
jgi:ABC-type multidrug transport system fused ATPase/permease subunit